MSIRIGKLDPDLEGMESSFSTRKLVQLVWAPKCVFEMSGSGLYESTLQSRVLKYLTSYTTFGTMTNNTHPDDKESSNI